MVKFLRQFVSQILRFQIKRLIRKHKPLIVAVTGSVGKTSTKLAIAKVLEAKYKVLVQGGNLNAEIGLEMAMLDLPMPTSLTSPAAWLKIFRQSERLIKSDHYPYDCWVVELGVDHPGEMAAHLNFFTPDVGVVTAIAPAHLEGFGSVEAIETEKLKLARAAKKVILNGDDERLAKAKEQFSSKPVFTYGLAHGDFRVEPLDYRRGSGYRVKLVLKQAELETELPSLVGEHSLYAASAAAAVGAVVGVGIGQIKEQLGKLVPVPGRMNPLAGINDSLIIDDSYNSSPEAAIAALATLYDFPSEGRRVAVLGSMNELGEFSRQAHEEVGGAAAKLDELITVGRDAKEFLAPAAVAAGLSQARIHTFSSPYEAGEFLKQSVKAGDLILAKGSQNGVFVEETIAKVLADPADKGKLVRQTPYWQKVKKETFSQ